MRKVTATTGTPIVFPQTAVGAVSAPIDVHLQNIGTTPLTLSSITVTPNFTVTDPDTTYAAGMVPLASAALCVLGSEFAPTAGGASTGVVTVSDNGLNVTTNQQILLSANSTSAPAVVTSTVLTANASTVTTGTNITFTAMVAEVASTSIPTGTVTFADGTTTLGSGTLNGSGVATFSTASLGVGAHTITATYGGDTTNAASTSTGLTITVNAPALIGTTTTLAASANPVIAGVTDTFTAKVAPASGTGTPSGNVTFYSGANPIGTVALNSSGVAALSYTFTSGPDTITATYAGNALYASSTSSGLTLTVNPAVVSSFSITAQTTSLAVISGASAQVPITATAINGTFSNAVTLSASGLPAGATATFSPVSITPGATSATSTLTISTVKAAVSSNRDSQPWSLAFFGVPLLGCLLCRPKRWRSFVSITLAGLGLAISTSVFTGCGQNGFNYTTTTAQTYSVVITGTSGATTANTTIQLTVTSTNP